MTAEGLRSVDLSLPGDHVVQILLQDDGKPFRESVAGQLGRRYFCGQDATVRAGEKQTTIRLPNDVVAISGEKIYIGCGTEVLCTKAPGTDKEDITGIPMCCDLPMSLQKPKPLPSSD